MTKRSADETLRRVTRAAVAVCKGEEVSVLGRPGSDLLFQALRLSTIGAGEFNGRVRDGIGYGLPANTTRPAKDGKSRISNQAWAQITTLDFEASWTF